MKTRLELLVTDLEEIGDRLAGLIRDAAHSELEPTRDLLVQARLVAMHTETLVIAASEKLPAAPKLEVLRGDAAPPPPPDMPVQPDWREYQA